MQLIFQGPPLAALVALPAHHRISEFLQRGDVRHFLIFFGVIFVLGQITGILGLWGASKAVAEKDHSTLGNAFKVWLFNWLVFVVIVAALCFIVPSVAKSDARSHALLLGGALLLLYVMLMLLIPMKVYFIGLLRSIGVLLLAGLISGGANTLLQVILMNAMGLGKDVVELQKSIGTTPAEHRAFGERLLGKEAPDEIDRMLDDAQRPIGPRPSLSERETLVRTLQQKLTARQKELQPGDTSAQSVYQAQISRYKAFLGEVLAERNGQPQPASQ
jgi:hypothetical protein